MNNFFTLIFLILIAGCSRRQDDSLLVIDTEETKPGEMKLSQMFQKEGMVILETNDSCLISNIRQVIKVKDNLFILSSHDIDNEILKFNTDGKYIGRIGRIGHGPGEYSQLRDLTVDTLNNRLIAGSDNGIIVYNFDGTLINKFSFKTPEIIEDLAWIDNSLLVFGIKFKTGSLIQYSMDIYDQNLKKQDSLILFVNKSEKLNIVQNTIILSDVQSGKYLYFPVIDKDVPLHDTIFKLKENNLIPTIRLKINSIEKNEDWKIENNGSPVFQDFLHINEAYRTDDFLFVNYQKVMPYLLIYSFNEKKGDIIRSGFTDDLLMPGQHNQLITPVPLNLRKGEFYYALSGVSVADKWQDVNENSNPVMFFLNLKKSHHNH
ncbi:MAG TPA: 6-bladed beta-propeller [Bacteroidales bacterium]|nr:6-bladed beta-propeller [Bacteroidales bacterium]